MCNIPDENIVILLTHHAPLRKGTSHSKYSDEITNYAYSSDQTELLDGTGITAWIFGHTHYTTDFVFDQTFILSNPLGYVNEETGYKKDKYIQIEE